jgi:hypothetical protein
MMASNNATNRNPILTNYISTNWYPPGNLNCGGYFPSTTAIATGTLYFIPFLVQKTTTFKAIGIWLVTGVALANINLGLYASNSTNTQPTGSPLANTTSGSIAATGSAVALSFTFGATKQLTPGLYWLAVTSSGAVTLQSFDTVAGFFNLTPTFGFTALAAVPANSYGWTQTFVYNTTLPAVGVLTSNSSPAIYNVMIQVN